MTYKLYDLLKGVTYGRQGQIKEKSLGISTGSLDKASSWIYFTITNQTIMDSELTRVWPFLTNVYMIFLAVNDYFMFARFQRDNKI